MALLQLSELRLYPRRRMLGSLPVRLYTADHKEISCRPLDVSAYGIGVFTEDEIGEVGDNFLLLIAEHEIALELVLSLENPGNKFGYRHGFKVINSALNLEKVLFELADF